MINIQFWTIPAGKAFGDRLLWLGPSDKKNGKWSDIQGNLHAGTLLVVKPTERKQVAQWLLGTAYELAVEEVVVASSKLARALLARTLTRGRGDSATLERECFRLVAWLRETDSAYRQMDQAMFLRHLEIAERHVVEATQDVARQREHKKRSS